MHPETYADRLHRALSELHAELFDENMNIKEGYSESIDCPVCKSSDAKSYCVKDGFRHRECNSCELVYLSPRLNKQATLAFYNSSANEVYNESKFHTPADGSSLDDKINHANALLISDLVGNGNGKKPLAGKKVLEIGCAKGYFLSCIHDLGGSAYGIELNKVNAAIASRRPGLIIYESDLFDLNLESESFDVVYGRDLIEHIHNPIPFLKELSRLMKPGALILLDTHNIDGFIHRITRGKHTCIFGFEHPIHWSPKTISNALDMVDIKVVKVKFQSLDFFPDVIIDYFKKSTWTTVFQWEANTKNLAYLNFLTKIAHLPFVGSFLSWVMPKFANSLKFGSTMKVAGFKRNKKLG